MYLKNNFSVGKLDTGEFFINPSTNLQFSSIAKTVLSTLLLI